MDPDACLEEIRTVVDQINDGVPGLATALAELVDALDEWIIGGGFLPRAWTNVVSEKDIADLEEA